MSIHIKRIIFAALLPAFLFVTGCDRSSTADAEESVLRVHDVSGLQVDELDDKLNKLLSREDLPLRGKVELLDDHRLAVNASRYLQNEIVAMIDQLREHKPGDAIERPFRVEFWLLRMGSGESSGDVPDYLSEALDPLLQQYPGYELSVDDYLESFHGGQAAINHISSGNGSTIRFRRATASDSGIELRARVYGSGSSINYEVNHTLEPGRTLVLGRAHDGGGAEKASYQILVARAEWTDSTD